MVLRIRIEDSNVIRGAMYAIYELLYYFPAHCRAAFIAADTEAALKEIIKIHPTDRDVMYRTTESDSYLLIKMMNEVY